MKNTPQETKKKQKSNIRLKAESNSCVPSRVAKCPTVAERESDAARARQRESVRQATRFEASPATLGQREANSVDKQPQQRTDANDCSRNSINSIRQTVFEFDTCVFIEGALFTCRDET